MTVPWLVGGRAGWLLGRRQCAGTAVSGGRWIDQWLARSVAQRPMVSRSLVAE